MLDDLTACNTCGKGIIGHLEAYLIPSSTLSRRLCATAHVAASSDYTCTIPSDVARHEGLLAVVHMRSEEDQREVHELRRRLMWDAAYQGKRMRYVLSCQLKICNRLHVGSFDKRVTASTPFCRSSSDIDGAI